LLPILILVFLLILLLLLTLPMEQLTLVTTITDNHRTFCKNRFQIGAGVCPSRATRTSAAPKLFFQFFDNRSRNRPGFEVAFAENWELRTENSPKSLVYKDFNSKSLFLKDLASRPSLSL